LTSVSVKVGYVSSLYRLGFQQIILTSDGSLDRIEVRDIFVSMVRGADCGIKLKKNRQKDSMYSAVAYVVSCGFSPEALPGLYVLPKLVWVDATMVSAGLHVEFRPCRSF